jgi:hypothetical protein
LPRYYDNRIAPARRAPGQIARELVLDRGRSCVPVAVAAMAAYHRCVDERAVIGHGIPGDGAVAVIGRRAAAAAWQHWGHRSEAARPPSTAT